LTASTWRGSFIGVRGQRGCNCKARDLDLPAAAHAVPASGGPAKGHCQRPRPAPLQSRQWAQRGDPRPTFWAGRPDPPVERDAVRWGEDESNGCAFRSGSPQGPVIAGGGGRADPHPEERGAADRDGRRGVAGFDLTVDAERGRDQDRDTGGGAAACSAPMSMPTTPFLAGGRPGGRCRARPPVTSPGPRVASVRQAQTKLR
jgi:hypothetical protein